MSLVAWIIAGLITGFLAGVLTGASKLGYLRDVLLGVVGAVIGGNFFNLIWTVDVDALNYAGLLPAVAGAVVLLGAYHLVKRHGPAKKAAQAQSRL